MSDMFTVRSSFIFGEAKVGLCEHSLMRPVLNRFSACSGVIGRDSNNAREERTCKLMNSCLDAQVAA
jgi:hypothetical protein